MRNRKKLLCWSRWSTNQLQAWTKALPQASVISMRLTSLSTKKMNLQRIVSTTLRPRMMRYIVPMKVSIFVQLAIRMSSDLMEILAIKPSALAFHTAGKASQQVSQAIAVTPTMVTRPPRSAALASSIVTMETTRKGNARTVRYMTAMS